MGSYSLMLVFMLLMGSRELPERGDPEITGLGITRDAG